MPGYWNRDSLSVPLTGQPDLESFSRSQPGQPTVESRAPRTGRSFEPYSAERNATPASSVAAESVRMVRQPNPYANVPSLYDLYIQAASNARPLERFGLDVFRKGAANPAYLPMDLPLGLNYVVAPGDTLSIALWGAASQRLLRTVNPDGRFALPCLTHIP